MGSGPMIGGSNPSTLAKQSADTVGFLFGLVSESNARSTNACKFRSGVRSLAARAEACFEHVAQGVAQRSSLQITNDRGEKYR